MKGIRLKLLIYTSLLLLLMLIINFLLQGNLITKFYTSNEKSTLIEYAEQISESYPNNIEKLKEDVKNVAGIVGGKVTVYDNNGNLIFQSGNYMFGKIIKIEGQYYKDVLKGQVIYKIDEMMQKQGKLITLGYPIEKDRVVGVIFIHSPSFIFEKDIDRLKNQFTILFIAAIIMSLFGAFIISKIFTNPILNIKDAAEKISKGNYKIRVDINSKDEIGELARTINDMASGLNKTEKLRRDFIANVTHEFRTPLGIIKGYAEALYDDLVPEDEKKEYIREIVEEVDKLNTLVNENLELSKIESGNIVLNMEKVNLLVILKEIVDKVKILKGNREIVLKGEEIYVKADEDLLKRAILNIISNSIKHTKEDGKIEIFLSDNKDKIKITIKDNGDGIEKHNIPYVFERFYRVKEKGVGGLGLSIAKEIINLHKGEIFVDSQVSAGTEFIILLNKES